MTTTAASSFDAYDEIYAKYSNAIQTSEKQRPQLFQKNHGRRTIGSCDPPPSDPPEYTKTKNAENDVSSLANNNNKEVEYHLYQASTTTNTTTPDYRHPTRDVSKLKLLLSECSSNNTRYQEPPEFVIPMESRDDDDNDDTVLDRQYYYDHQGCCRDSGGVGSVRSPRSIGGESVQYRLDKFNAKRLSMRSIYGSPITPATKTTSSSSGGGTDPPDLDIDSRLAFLTKQSLARRATIFPSKSKSSHSKKPYRTWDDFATTTNNNTIASSPASSSSLLPMRSLAMRLISEQIFDGYKMIQDKCSDCTMNLVEATDGSGISKCAFCPINDFRAIIQGLVSNRVMAVKRIQGNSAAVVFSDSVCKQCYSPTQEGISCEVCPILDEICIEVARAIGRGGTITSYYCNDCGCQRVKSSSGVHCIVCSQLNQKLGERQVYKAGKAFISPPSISLKSYQDTLDETTQLLETIKSQDNSSPLQIQLDEELVKAKNAQSLLGTTLGNIAYENKTSGIRTELKAELLKAKEAQMTLQKMLESSGNAPNKNVKTKRDGGGDDDDDDKSDDIVDISGSSYANSSREVDAGNVKEYIPPPKHFFQRGIPTTVWVEQRTRGDISVGTSYYTTNLRQSAARKERIDCCGVRIRKQSPYDEGTEFSDDGSIGTDDYYSEDISLNSYHSYLSGDDDSWKHRGHEFNRDEKTKKVGRLRGCLNCIIDLFGRHSSFDETEEQTSLSYYHTNYRPHQRYSFDGEDDTYQYARRTKFHRDDESSRASMFSDITPHGILKSPRYRSPSPRVRSPSPNDISVMTDDHSRMSCRGQHKRNLSSTGNSVSSIDYRRVSFYNHNLRDLDIDKLKTLTEEGGTGMT